MSNLSIPNPLYGEYSNYDFWEGTTRINYVETNGFVFVTKDQSAGAEFTVTCQGSYNFYVIGLS